MISRTVTSNACPKSTYKASVALMVLLVALAGCHKKPGGQVLAVVNNEEITQQELRAEAEATQLPPGQDMAAATPILLQRVIERNLLAGYARAQGMDRGPDYVARRRQLEQALLANLAMRKLVGAQKPPTPAEVQAYIASHPTYFAQRQKLALDQIRIPTPADVKQVQALTKLGSLAAIATKLTADGIQFTRDTPTLDTASIDPAVSAQILALPAGQVFDLSTNGLTFFNLVTNRTSVAAQPSTWTGPATEAVRRETLAKTVAAAIAKLKSEARIDYDPAMKPKATK